MSKVSKKNEKTCLAYVLGGKDTFFVFIYKDKKVYKKFVLSTVKELFKSLLPLKSELQAAFLCVENYESQEYKNSYESSKVIREFLVRHSIPCHFFTFEYEMKLNILVAANFTPSIDDFIVIINFGKDGIVFNRDQFTRYGYKTGIGQITKETNLESHADCFSELMKPYNMKKMVITTNDKDNKLFKDFIILLKSGKYSALREKVIVVDSDKYDETQISGKTIHEMAKWFFDKSYLKFYFPPVIPKTVEILSVVGNSRKKIIVAEDSEEIPFVDSIVIRKSVQQCLMLEYENEKSKILEAVKMDEKCHQRKITLTFESECFPELKIEPIILFEIEKLPKKLDEICKSKIPVVGFFDHSSVVCVYKNDGYKFLDSWNGLYGNELFINFGEKETKYGMEAIKADKTRMSSVVYDLITILSKPADKIGANEDWKFVITKDSENPVLIEFDYFGGIKKAATPQFLMAMILKENIKRIKNEMNEEKPKEVGFCFFDKMSEAEKKRVEAGIEEACKLLKIACIFVKV